MGIDRRSIVKLLIGGAVGSVFTPIPWKLTDDISIWTQNWSWVPKNIDGKDAYVPTVSKLCPTATAMLVRTVSGRPVRTIGNPEHPLSGGKISPLAATEVQMLYSPSRIKRPLRKTSDGAWKEISWTDALALLDEKLGFIKGSGARLAVISGDQTGTINEVLSAFVSLMGSKQFFLMPSDAQTLASAWELMGGAGVPGFETAGSDFVLALGADILESWGPATRTRRAYSAARPHGEAPMAKYVYVGPSQTNTAVGSDLWVAARPGSQAVVALGLANLLIKAGFTSQAADFAAFKALAAKFEPAVVAQMSGVSEDKLTMLAEGLKSAKAPVVIPGSEFGQGGSPAAVAAGMALNLLLGAFNQKTGLRAVPEFAPVVEKAMPRKAVMANDLVAYMQSLAGDDKAKPDVLITYEANPVYALPLDVAATLAKIPFKVAIAQFMDETATMADLVLPSPLGIERYDDVATPAGCGTAVYCLNKPVIDAVNPGANIHGGDVILGIAAKLNANLGFNSFKDVLAAKAKAVGANAADLAAGKPFVSDAVTGGQPSMAAEAIAKSLEIKAPEAGLTLAAVNKLGFGTATTAVPPQNLKLIREFELTGTLLYVHLNKSTASKAGVAQGQKVTLKGASGVKIPAVVNISEMVMDGVVMAPCNFGHTAFDEFAKDKGANVAKLFAAQVEPGSGLSIWTQTGVAIEKA
ncbi:menaquinone reductase molybdopterin-binding-like subunit QrcB [Megalodesulfovibrio paquesii]